MIVQWLGHSCFRVESDAYAIVLDPYADGKVPGLRPLDISANEVLCSHAHDDHSAAALVRLEGEDGASPFQIMRIESFHDDQGGALRGPNTIHVLEADEVRIAHLGDLGAQLTAGQVAAIGRLDALMIPVGGHYTLDAEGAKAVVDALRPHVVLPMHYRSDAFGFDNIGTLEPFLALCKHVEHSDSDTLEIVRHMPREVTVLTYL